MSDLMNGSGMTPASRRRFLQTMLASGAAATLPDFCAYAAALSTPVAANVASRASVRLANPYMQAVSADVLNQLKYAFTAAASGVPGNGNAFAEPCRAFVASRKPARQATLRTIATQTLTRSPGERTAMFGKYAATDAAAFLATDSKVMALRAGIAARPAGFNVATLKPDPADDNFHFADDGFLSDAEIKKKQEEEEAQAQQNAEVKADLEEGAKYKHLELRLYEVKILKGTGDAGDTEEIALGGCVIGATGNYAKIKRFLVADDFDTDADDRQHKKYYNINGWHLGWYQVVRYQPFPRWYTAQLAMAELDNGGFGDFLIGLWNKVKIVVKQIIDDALTSVLGPIGYAIGEIIGAFLDWFIGLFHNEDDILGVRHPQLKLSSHSLKKYKAFGLLDDHGRTKWLDYKGSGGWYQALIGWKIMQDEGYNLRKASIQSHAHMYNAAEEEAQ